MTKAQLKKVDARINKAYTSSCQNVQIPMLQIPEVFKVGRQAIAEGADDEALKAKIVAFVATIRTN
jgi:hypothetical protein